MYVCLSVTGLRLKYIYGFTHSLRTSVPRAAHDVIAMEIEVEDSDNRRRRQNESRCMEDR